MSVFYLVGVRLGSATSTTKLGVVAGAFMTSYRRRLLRESEEMARSAPLPPLPSKISQPSGWDILLAGVSHRFCDESS